MPKKLDSSAEIFRTQESSEGDVMRRVMVNALAIFAMLFLPPADASAQQLRVTYPTPNSTVPGEVVQVKGVGADPAATLKVEVLTNQWWPQDGVAHVNADGSWTYSPCHLSGKTPYNNHTIRVTVVRNGQTLRSAEVSGVRR